MAKARSSAEQALVLDPNLSDAHNVQGYNAENLDFNLAAAEAEYRRALELAPQNVQAMGNLSSLLAEIGRLDEAVALNERAIPIEPLRANSYTNLGNQLTVLGRYDEAEARLRKAIELQPQASTNFMLLARLQICRGKTGAAVDLAKQETDLGWRTYALALAYSANGDHAEADAALKKMIDENADESGTQIASVYAVRKEPEEMFKWLEHAWETHDPGVLELLEDPFIHAYRNDPRFIAFARKIGVMPR
jgi:serine/threonine-protein kinase